MQIMSSNFKEFDELYCRYVKVDEAGTGWIHKNSDSRPLKGIVLDELDLHSEWAVFMELWRSLISGKKSNPSWAWKKWTF